MEQPGRPVGWWWRQYQLDQLESYAAAWGLTVNAAKTQVVVFEGRGRRQQVPAPHPAPAGLAFSCAGDDIAIAEEFRYLGVQFHCRHAFSTAGAARAQAGGRAVHATRRRCADLGLHSAAVQLRLFDTMVLPALSYGAEIWAPQLIAAGNRCAATRIHHAFLRQLLGVRQSTPALVLLAETRQRPLAARWAAPLARFWNSVLDGEEDSLARRALADSCALAEGAQAAQLACKPWAGQVAAALGTLGAAVSLEQPEPVSVPDLIQAGTDAFHTQLAAAQGTRARQYVASTGVGAGDGSSGTRLPSYLLHIPQRSRRRALAQLRTGSHWLAEERGRWQQQQRGERLCLHCAAAGEQHTETAEHAILHCPQSAALRARYASLFVDGRAASLPALLHAPDVLQLASFCRDLCRLHCH